MDESAKYTAEAVGKRVEALRKTTGLNQTDFASRAKVVRESVSLWERGKQRPGIGPAQKLADTYGVTLDWIFLGRKETLRYGVAQKLDELTE